MSDTAHLIQEQRRQDLQLLKKILLYCLGGSAVAHAVMFATGTMWWKAPVREEVEETIDVVVLEDTTQPSLEPPIENSEIPPESIDNTAPSAPAEAFFESEPVAEFAASTPEAEEPVVQKESSNDKVLTKVGDSEAAFTVGESSDDGESDSNKSTTGSRDGSEVGSGVGPIAAGGGGFSGLFPGFGGSGDGPEGGGDGRLREPVSPSRSGGQPSTPSEGDGSGLACTGSCEGSYERDESDTVERNPLIRARRNEDGELEFELLQSSGSAAADAAALETAREASYSTDRDEFTIRAIVADEGTEAADRARDRVRQQQERVSQPASPPQPMTPPMRTAGESYDPPVTNTTPTEPVAPSEPTNTEPIAPEEAAPADKEPVYTEEPVYEEPAYEEPVEEPVYEEPVYEEPVYEEPVYEEPVYEEPAYEEPAYEEPVYEEPAYTPSAPAQKK